MITVSVNRKDFVNGHAALAARARQEERKLEAYYGRPVVVFWSAVRYSADGSRIWVNLTPDPDAKLPQ